MLAKDIVFLVPGFLGFSRFGGFYYFADRVSAVIRGVLESRLLRSVPVVPISTEPTGGLATRQTALLASIERLLRTEVLREIERVHLVGYSAGGVDAQLLTCTRPVSSPHWSSNEERIRSRLHSVVGLAAPHYGTAFAMSILARFARHPLENAALVPSLVPTMVDFVRLFRHEPSAAEGIAGALVAPPTPLKFLAQIWHHRELVDDLQPARMESLRSELRSEGRVPLTSFVSVTTIEDEEARKADPFFRDLHRMTAGDKGVIPSLAVSRTISRLNAPSVRYIANETSARPIFDICSNDGVVNSSRQLCDPTDANELAAVVIGDHADILGHYDRVDDLVEVANRSAFTLNAGLFHSGAQFGDNQFYELYRSVAESILRSIL